MAKPKAPISVTQVRGAPVDGIGRSIVHKARSGTVEVEDILGLASKGNSSHAALLRELAAKHAWSRGPGGAGKPVPLARWADAVCAFLEAGYDGVERFGTDDPAQLAFSIGVLEGLKTSESVRALLRLAEGPTGQELAIAAALTVYN